MKRLFSRSIAALSTWVAVSACGRAGEPRYPAPEEVAGAALGELVSRPAQVEVGGKLYDAEFGTLTVLEDRAKPEGRRIQLPVVRVHSTSSERTEPVFLLEGGPGQTNIPTRPPSWVLDHHDAVMVGYRGVDGSVSLDCPRLDLRSFRTDPSQRRVSSEPAGPSRRATIA